MTKHVYFVSWVRRGKPEPVEGEPDFGGTEQEFGNTEVAVNKPLTSLEQIQRIEKKLCEQPDATLKVLHLQLLRTIEVPDEKKPTAGSTATAVAAAG